MHCHFNCSHCVKKPFMNQEHYGDKLSPPPQLPHFGISGYAPAELMFQIMEKEKEKEEEEDEEKEEKEEEEEEEEEKKKVKKKNIADTLSYASGMNKCSCPHFHS